MRVGGAEAANGYQLSPFYHSFSAPRSRWIILFSSSKVKWQEESDVEASRWHQPTMHEKKYVCRQTHLRTVHILEHFRSELLLATDFSVLGGCCYCFSGLVVSGRGGVLLDLSNL